jgi:hypothetical protein
VSTVNRVGLVVAVVVALVPATAHAARPVRTPAETARAYVAALERHDIQDACSLLDSSTWTSRRSCPTTLEETPAIRRVRIEPGALTRGTRARVVVGLVVDDRPGPPHVSRSRVLLRRIDGRWRIVVAGGPLAVGPWRSATTPDPAPTGAAAALRRLADDELLALSGNGSMLCGLLARGAPLGGSGGGCARVDLYDRLNDGAELAARLARFAVRVTAPGRARLDITAVGTRAVRSARRPGYALRSRRWSDTLFAVRSGGRWKLAKPSRSLYLALGVPAPADVGSPSKTAVWPGGGEVVPSLSERTAPGCETPSVLWAMTCFHFDGLASGAGLVAWSAGYEASARPVAAGVAAGTTATVAPRDRPAYRLWSVTGIAPVGDGALVIETGFGDPETRAIPVGRDGRPRGPVQMVDGVTDGSSDDGLGSGAVVVPMPAGSATATVLTATDKIVRLGADGRPAGPAGTLEEDLNSAEGLLVGRADGTLLWFAAKKDGAGIAVTALDAGGNPVGDPVAQPGAGAPLGSSFAAAEDAAGRVFAGWIEEGPDHRRTLRTWVLDPSAPGATAPVSRVEWTGTGSGTEVTDDVAVSALPDGGWGLALSGGSELVAGRLQPSGAWLARPQRVALGFSGTLLDAQGFGLAGDTVAWIAPPPVAGLSQVRSAPLP